MLNNLLKVTKNVISKCVKPVLESAKKAFQPQIKNLQNSTLGKAAAKLLPVVNSPAVKSGFSQVQKALALPKTVAPAKKEVASTPQSSSNNQAKQLSTSSNSPAPKEENVQLLEQYKGNETSKSDIIRGEVKSGALRLFYDAGRETFLMPGILTVLRIISPPEYKSLNFKAPYELLKADIKDKFNQAGNDVYNAQIPIASNLIGAFTNSSDYKEHGPLPLESPKTNHMLAMMNYFMYGVSGGGILNQADVMTTYQSMASNTNMASVIGANAGGALITGGAGMADSIIEAIIDPYEFQKNLSDLVINSPVIIPALLNEIGDYSKHYVYEATPQEKARVKGRIAFEIASYVVLSALGKATKGAEAAQGAQKTESMVKNGSEASALGKEGGVNITKTEDVLTANKGVGEVVEEGVKKSSGNAGKTGEAIEGSGNASWKASLGSGKIGDFSNIQGGTIEEILSRIPKDAQMRVLKPVAGKVETGVEFSWKAGDKTMRVRIHDIDLSAPAGSNAANGWVVRVQEGKKYLDPDTGIFQPPGISNPDSPFYDPNLGNSTHIPIQTPREEIINELIRSN